MRIHDDTKYPINKVAGYNVRRLRLLRGMTVHELSVDSRIKESAINRLERQKGGIYLWRLGKLAEALQVDLQELFVIPNERLDTYVKTYVQHSREL